MSAARSGAAAGLLIQATLWAGAAAAAAPVLTDPPLPVARPRDLDRRPEMQGPPMPPRPAPAVPLAPPAPVSAVPSGTQTAAAPPGDCSAQLRAAGVVFVPTTVGPQPEPACVVSEPVKLTGLNPSSGLPVDFPDRPTLACAAALAFADYLRMLLVPLTRGQFGSAITAVGTGPGLECRTRDHIPGAKISAHGMGLAIDIAAVTLSNGRTLAIGAPKDDTERMFDRAARAGACGFFHTALGPGADAFHETHWHFDLLPRGRTGDSKICQ
jgi:hypothetical protein